MAATVVETLAAWNSVITQVNTLAQAPPSGCSAQTALTLVTAPHRWSKTDVTQVQTTLKAICSNNTFSTIPDKWQQSILDEINTALAVGWCNCGCHCKNVKPAVTFFLGTWTQQGCTEADDTNFYALCNPSGGPLRQCWAYGQTAQSFYRQYDGQLRSICGLEQQLKVLNAALVALIAALPTISEAPTPAYLAAQAKVQAKQAEIQAMQTKISTTRQAAVTAYKTPGDDAADQCMAALAALHWDTEPSFNIVPLFQNFTIPQNVDVTWPPIDPNTCCSQMDCAVGWSLQWRLQSSSGTYPGPMYGLPGPWSTVLLGKFGPTGKPYLIWSYQCPLGGMFVCYSNHCSVGAQLPICQGIVTYAVQLVITYPVA